MCLVRSGRGEGGGGRNCREDLLAGGQPPIRPSGGEKRAASFPRPVTKRLYVPRSIDGVMRLFKLATRTHAREDTPCSILCNLSRWNTIETVRLPVTLAFQPCVLKWETSKWFRTREERERERFARERNCKGGGKGVFLRNTQNTEPRKLFAVLSANRVAVSIRAKTFINRVAIIIAECINSRG